VCGSSDLMVCMYVCKYERLVTVYSQVVPVQDPLSPPASQPDADGHPGPTRQHCIHWYSVLGTRYSVLVQERERSSTFSFHGFSRLVVVDSGSMTVQTSRRARDEGRGTREGAPP
jgi:hypothetical protein